MKFNKLLNKLRIPPTRCIRYDNSHHNFVQKNSLRIPVEHKKRPIYQTFDVIWNEEMSKYKLKCTTEYYK